VARHAQAGAASRTGLKDLQGQLVTQAWSVQLQAVGWPFGQTGGGRPAGQSHWYSQAPTSVHRKIPISHIGHVSRQYCPAGQTTPLKVQSSPSNVRQAPACSAVAPAQASSHELPKVLKSVLQTGLKSIGQSQQELQVGAIGQPLPSVPDGAGHEFAGQGSGGYSGQLVQQPPWQKSVPQAQSSVVAQLAWSMRQAGVSHWLGQGQVRQGWPVLQVCPAWHWLVSWHPRAHFLGVLQPASSSHTIPSPHSASAWQLVGAGMHCAGQGATPQYTCMQISPLLHVDESRQPGMQVLTPEGLAASQTIPRPHSQSFWQVAGAAMHIGGQQKPKQSICSQILPGAQSPAEWQPVTQVIAPLAPQGSHTLPAPHVASVQAGGTTHWPGQQGPQLASAQDPPFAQSAFERQPSTQRLTPVQAKVSSNAQTCPEPHSELCWHPVTFGVQVPTSQPQRPRHLGRAQVWSGRQPASRWQPGTQW
jgi:hypothetical protein